MMLMRANLNLSRGAGASSKRTIRQFAMRGSEILEKRIEDRVGRHREGMILRAIRRRIEDAMQKGMK